MRFSKMHGLGNDFVVVDSITQKVHLTTDKIKILSDRHCGIGFDQLLIVEPPYDPIIDFHCRIYNSDGSEVHQCGNGMRCVARFVYLKKLTNKHTIKISTRSVDIMTLSAIHDDLISINMGEPIFEPQLIPFYSYKNQKIYILFLPNQITVLCGVVSLGNPHCVILINSIKSTLITKLGPLVTSHHRFPEQVNVSFMHIIDKQNINLRVYERGVGETQACGSAACAAVAVGIHQGLLKKTELVTVNLPGGTLLVSWKGPGYSLYMIGSTAYVYDGFIYL